MVVTYNIKKIRNEKNMSLDTLSARSYISKAQISDIERNIKHPTVPTLIMIAIALNVDFRELVNVRYSEQEK